MTAWYYTAVALITAFLVSQLVSASRTNRRGLWLLTIVFLIYFVYSSTVELELSRDYYSFFFDVREGYLVAAVWLLLLVVVCVRWGYSRQQVIGEPRHAVPTMSYRQALIISLAGLVCGYIQFSLAGGLEVVWSRKPEPFEWAGLISGLVQLSVVFPLLVYHDWPKVRRSHAVYAVLITGTYAGFAVVSGESTRHVVAAIPFLVLWLSKHRVTVLRAALVVTAGFVLISGTRFMRQLGNTLAIGGDWYDAYREYSDPMNMLNARNSFYEFIMFAETVQLTETESGFRWGTTYLAPIVSLIPSALLEGKDEKELLVWHYRPDDFVPDYLGYGFTPGGLDYVRYRFQWPSGFYGEAYMNFGIIGLIAASMLFGWAVRRSELLLESPGSLGGLPRWYVGCVLLAALVSGVRMGFVDIFWFSALPLALAIALLCILSVVTPVEQGRRNTLALGKCGARLAS
jgi:hypothetical protein